MPPRARSTAKKAVPSTVDDDQEASGQTTVDSDQGPEALPVNENTDLGYVGAIETPGLEIVPAVRVYRATHAFNDWAEGEERELALGDPYAAGLVAGGFLVQVD